MKIKILDKIIHIPTDKHGQYWKFRFFILTIKASTYNKTKVYIQMYSRDRPIINKITDMKW